jgi:hypothetical protein
MFMVYDVRFGNKSIGLYETVEKAYNAIISAVPANSEWIAEDVIVVEEAFTSGVPAVLIAKTVGGNNLSINEVLVN